MSGKEDDLSLVEQPYKRKSENVFVVQPGGLMGPSALGSVLAHIEKSGKTLKQIITFPDVTPTSYGCIYGAVVITEALPQQGQ